MPMRERMTDGKAKGTYSDVMLARAWMVACPAVAAAAMRRNGRLTGTSLRCGWEHLPMGQRWVGGKSKHKCWFELLEKLELSCLEIGRQQLILGHLDSGPGGSPGCVDSI